MQYFRTWTHAEAPSLWCPDARGQGGDNRVGQIDGRPRFATEHGCLGLHCAAFTLTELRSQRWTVVSNGKVTGRSFKNVIDHVTRLNALGLEIEREVDDDGDQRIINPEDGFQILLRKEPERPESVPASWRWHVDETEFYAAWIEDDASVAARTPGFCARNQRDIPPLVCSGDDR